MRVGCKGCPYPDFQYFYDYYGRDDYAHRWVEAAFGGTKTDFARGDADFSRLGLVGRGEAVKKGSAYLNVFMYVMYELEDAVDDCERGCLDCNDSPVHAWDEGVVSAALCRQRLRGPASLPQHSRMDIFHATKRTISITA